MSVIPRKLLLLILVSLGKRNQLYEEVESREKKEQEIKVLIREKKEELERLRFQFNSC